MYDTINALADLPPQRIQPDSVLRERAIPPMRPAIDIPTPRTTATDWEWPIIRHGSPREASGAADSARAAAAFPPIACDRRNGAARCPETADS